MLVLEKQLPTLEGLSAESLRSLLSISTRLSSTLHLDELLLLVMDVATQLTHTQTASILLLDDNTGQLHFAASTEGTIPTDIIVPIDDSIAGWVVQNGESLIVTDVNQDSRFYSSVDEKVNFETRSMLAVPLITNGKSIGALEVINKQDNLPYTPQDVVLMEALASQSAVAIMNARLFNQSDLLAEIMHELKTPMMAIQTASELLIRPDLPQDQHGKLIQMIRRESQRLARMTKDFLDFARLESGRERLSREFIDISQLILEVEPISQPQAAKRGIQILTELGPDLPTPEDNIAIIGDYDRLKQVLLNLVSNAVKYNIENGRVTITATKQEDTIHLAVTDTGQGIAPEDIEHLFERFYRIPGSDAEGTGLGLSVARKIVEQHNGRIDVQSTLGQGTTFTMILPLTPVEEA